MEKVTAPETYGLRDALAGGPGLDGYSYNADVYCVPCGRGLSQGIFGMGRRVDWQTFTDSGIVPQPIFFGESDYPENCAHCGALLPTRVIGEGRV